MPPVWWSGPLAALKAENGFQFNSFVYKGLSDRSSSAHSTSVMTSKLETSLPVRALLGGRFDGKLNVQ